MSYGETDVAMSNPFKPMASAVGRGFRQDYQEKNTTTRLTSGVSASTRPLWTPDGHRLVFTSARDGLSANLFWQRADGTGDVQRLTSSPHPQYAGSWHPNGKIVAFHEVNPQTNADIMIMTMEGDESSGWKPAGRTVRPPFPAGSSVLRTVLASPVCRALTTLSCCGNLC
jgi:tricorn protease-like protein